MGDGQSDEYSGQRRQLTRMNLRTAGLLAAAALLSACLLSCGTHQPGLADPPRQVVLPKPQSGYFADVTWLSSSALIVEYAVNPSEPGSVAEVWRVRPDGSGFSRVNLPNDPGCRQTEYSVPTSLADGRFAIEKSCLAPFGQFPVAHNFVLAVDASRMTTEILVDLPKSAKPTSMSWNIKVDQAIAGDGSGICATIYWLGRRGVTPLTVSVGAGNKSWRLDDPRLTDPNQCGDPSLGRADGPAWSPDGRTIAFVASPQSIGLRGQDRLDAPWNLYLMDPAGQQPRQALSPLNGPSNLAWSPDSRWLAFSGSVQDKGSGTWLYRPATATLRRITTDAFEILSWSPDGRKVAALWDQGKLQYPPATEIVTIDVSSLLK
jgi:WD40 repeat protein